MDSFIKIANRYKSAVDNSWDTNSLSRILRESFTSRNPNSITDAEISALLSSRYGMGGVTVESATPVTDGVNINNADLSPPHKSPVYESTGQGFWGGVKDGYILSQQVGYKGDDKQVHPRFSIPFYVAPKQGDPSYPEQVTGMGYRVGRVLGDITGNAHRSILWRMHPADYGSTLAWKTIVNTPDGLPPNTLEATALGTAGAFLTVEALGQLSGNYNPLNISEGMRPDGFQALSPDELNPTKSTDPALDLVQRYLLGRRGRILDWEDFKQERPDISYEKYQAYRDWQSGKTTDPLGQATFGIVKFNPDGIQNQPEAQVVGYNVTPTGVLGAGTVIGAGVLLNKHLGKLHRASQSTPSSI